MIKKLLNLFVGKWNRDEYVKSQIYSRFNERPVEYGFVFDQIAEHYPKTILDVGTGLTALPHLMVNCGCRVTAIDNIKDYWTSGMFNRHFHIINDDITDTRLTEKFDMITCVSTLEHIEKYDAAIKNMFSLLKDGGILVLTCPYNERTGVPNVYDLPGSSVKNKPRFKTRAFCRKDVVRWQNENSSKVIKQEYWNFFTGEYWTTGEMSLPPKRVSSEENHQISCMAFTK